MKPQNHEERSVQRLRRIARAWSAVLVIYALLALGQALWNLATVGVVDPHAVEGYGPGEALPPILMLLSILGLALAWRWEGWGGAIAVLFQLANLLVLFVERPISQGFARAVVPYAISLAIAIPGVLFLDCWWHGRDPSGPDRSGQDRSGNMPGGVRA